MIYAERYPKLETAAEFRRQNDFSWEGSGCEKGKILNGEGTMTETFVGNVDVRKGRMVNGVFDGPATLTSGSFFANIVYTRGCRFQDGSFDTACTPRPLTSSSHKRTLKSRK